MTILASGLSLYLAMTLGAAAFLKRPMSLRITLLKHGIFDRPTSRFLSWFVPAVEIAIACLLVSGFRPIGVAVATISLFLTFLGYRVVLLRAGVAAGCGCIGANGPRVESSDVGASIVMAGSAAVYLAVLHFGSKPDTGVVSAIVGLIISLLCIVRFTRWLLRSSNALHRAAEYTAR